MIKRFKLWNGWRKNSLDHWITKLLILFNIVKSPTFLQYCYWKDWVDTDFIFKEEE